MDDLPTLDYGMFHKWVEENWHPYRKLPTEEDFEVVALGLAFEHEARLAEKPVDVFEDWIDPNDPTYEKLRAGRKLLASKGIRIRLFDKELHRYLRWLFSLPEQQYPGHLKSQKLFAWYKRVSK